LAYAGRVIYSPVTGLLAAALGLTAPVFLAMSGTLLSHPTSLFFTTLFLWAFASLSRSDYARSGSPNPGENGDFLTLPPRENAAIPSERTSNLKSLVQRPTGSSGWVYAIVAGLALGCLFITRPFDAVGVSLPFAVYVLIRVLLGDRTLLRQGMVIAAIVVISGLLLLAYWYSLAGTIGNPYTMLWPYDRPGFGPDFGPEGYTMATGVRYLRSNLRALATGFLGWPGYLNALFLLLPFILRPRDRWNYLLLTSFLSLALLHVTYWYYGGRDAGFPRYYYAGLPMLLLLTARGVELAGLALHRLFRRARFPYRETASVTNIPITSLPIYLALITLVLYSALVFLPPNLNAFRGKSGITAAPLRVVQESDLTNAIVFVADVDHWYDFAVFFSVNSPTLDSGVVYAIYHNRPQAQGVRDLFLSRDCYIQSKTQLRPCSF
jgi:4-amino-4-deoxy-L-arabinose transferase-like glycosyltransferase